MSYKVKEMYYTLQGEGMQAGRSAVFCRFTGCNLWSGREQDRAKAQCRFCDTDFVGTDGEGGGRFADPESLGKAIQETWDGSTKAQDQSQENEHALVVFTGGEPLLQLDQALVDHLHSLGFEIAVETNGTQKAPQGIDHICVSPKANAPLVLTEGHELKLVYPQVELQAQPELFTKLNFKRFYLQPMDGPKQAENTQAAIKYCLMNPQWRLSLQTHKYIGIP